MEKRKWARTGDIYNPVFGSEVMGFPEEGIFELKISQTEGVYLQKVADKFVFPFEVYETSETKTQVKVVKKTFESEIMTKNLRSLGIILNGCKGSGKTVTAKQICNVMQMPVIIVKTMTGIVETFLSELDFNCVILIDEFEKIVPIGSDQSLSLLRLLDGVGKNINDSRKVFIMTSNSLKNIDSSFKSRLSRVRYIFEYSKRLPSEVVDSYLEKHLEDEDMRLAIKSFTENLGILTFDVLSQIVEEIIIHGSLKDTKDSLNVESRRTRVCFFYLSVPINGLDEVNKILAPLGGPEGLGKIMSTSPRIYNLLGGADSNEDVTTALDLYRITNPTMSDKELLRELTEAETRDIIHLLDDSMSWNSTSISRFQDGIFYVDEDSHKYRLNGNKDTYMKGIDLDGHTQFLYFQGQVLNVLGLKP